MQLTLQNRPFSGRCLSKGTGRLTLRVNSWKSSLPVSSETGISQLTRRNRCSSGWVEIGAALQLLGYGASSPESGRLMLPDCRKTSRENSKVYKISCSIGTRRAPPARVTFAQTFPRKVWATLLRFIFLSFSRPAGRDQRLCLWNPPPFEKGGRKLYFLQSGFFDKLWRLMRSINSPVGVGEWEKGFGLFPFPSA